MPSNPLYRLPTTGERNTAAGIFVSSIGSIVGILILVLWVGTQWAAWKLGYQSALGVPLYEPDPGVREWLLVAAVAAFLAGTGSLAFARLRRWCPALLALGLLAWACWWGCACWFGLRKEGE